MLTDIIAKYHDAKRVWEAQFDVDDKLASQSPEWDAYMDLGETIISYCAGSIEELHLKAETILASENLFDIVKRSQGDKPLRTLLASLIGPERLLDLAIDDYRRTLAEWLATSKDGADLQTDCSEYTAHVNAEFAFIVHPCATVSDVNRKIALVNEMSGLAYSIKMGENGDGKSYQRLFLNSLVGAS